MVRVKICGITNPEDARAAVAAGADALGFVFAAGPRRVGPEEVRAITADLPPLVARVGVFVNEDPERMLEIKRYCGLDALQLHGSEPEDLAAALGRGVIKALAVGPAAPQNTDAYAGALLLLDTLVPGRAGGTGQTFDWTLARALAARRPVMLAGGLNPDNIISAIEIVQPFAVDVSSGVEQAPGRKDHDLIRQFVTRAKQARHA